MRLTAIVLCESRLSLLLFVRWDGVAVPRSLWCSLTPFFVFWSSLHVLYRIPYLAVESEAVDIYCTIAKPLFYPPSSLPGCITGQTRVRETLNEQANHDPFLVVCKVRTCTTCICVLVYSSTFRCDACNAYNSNVFEAQSWYRIVRTNAS